MWSAVPSRPSAGSPSASSRPCSRATFAGHGAWVTSSPGSCARRSEAEAVPVEPPPAPSTSRSAAATPTVSAASTSEIAGPTRDGRARPHRPGVSSADREECGRRRGEERGLDEPTAERARHGALCSAAQPSIVPQHACGDCPGVSAERTTAETRARSSPGSSCADAR